MKTLFLILALCIGASAQIVVTGNPSCNTLGFTSELKIEPPRAGTYQIPNVGSVTVTINTNSTMSWTSSSPAFVRAAIMKGGPNANVYFYNPVSLGADGLSTINGQDISHISFCYNLAPTAAPVSYSGQVVNFYGRPVSKAYVTITNATTGEKKQALTNGFGYFSVEGLTVNDFYSITVTAKGLQFLPVYESLYDSVSDRVITALY